VPGHGPPGVTPGAGARRNHVGGNGTAVSAALVSRYVTLARSQPELADLSANKISRVVRAFLATGLQEREFLQYVVGYSDPTGETAVRNVMRERVGR
jgi:hypothetical protein